MSTKYEIIQIDNVEVTVDVSLLIKSEELFFNATEMAKAFGKRPNDFWKQPQNEEYLEALITLSGVIKNREDFVRTKRGKCGGTYFHSDLALQFARWLNPMFGVKLDKWVVSKLKEEQERKRSRLEARTGYLPMTNAILAAHDPAKFYHFSNEADLLNKTVTGLTAKKFKEKYGTDSARDYMTAAQAQELDKLQRINTSLIEIGMPYEERKGHLHLLHEKEQRLLDGK